MDTIQLHPAALPVLETERLTIRRFTLDDLSAAHQMYQDAGWLDPDLSEDETMQQRRRWLEWTVRNYDALAELYQPPYGDYAIVLKRENCVIGGVGLVQCIGPYGRLPYYRQHNLTPDDDLNMPEVGLFWALMKDYHRQGYATEAAQAITDYAFNHMHLKRIIATTDYDNAASIGVMRKLGMQIQHNPQPEPVWLQVVGVLENPGKKVQ
ncbi:MAG: GNAT family N-acetyltransferase [Anaerolineae bacterium]|nr:GNAT family N-acetyltransferase [Anaerolineae bacterium]